MGHYKRFIFIALVIFLSGCTAQRRYHQGGIHIDWQNFGHQESSDKNHQDKSARKSVQKAVQKAAHKAENRFFEQQTAVSQIPHPSNTENALLQNKVVTQHEIDIASGSRIEDQTTQFANFTNVQNTKDQHSETHSVANSESNQNPRQNKGEINASGQDPDQV